MTSLAKVISGKCVSPRRLFLYGLHGVGKSTFAAGAPRAIFLPTEDGLNDIDCHRFPLLTNLEGVYAALRSLYEDKHDYQTVVIDSLDWLERIIWDELCVRRSISSIEDVPYGKGYVMALSFWRQVLEGLDALRKTKGMHVILLAHAKIERFEAPDTESYDRYVPRLHRLASQLIQEWCDEVFFAAYKVYVTHDDQRPRAVGSGERLMRTSERPAWVAKNRLSLPEELPLSWAAYSQFFPTQKGQKNG